MTEKITRAERLAREENLKEYLNFTAQTISSLRQQEFVDKASVQSVVKQTVGVLDERKPQADVTPFTLRGPGVLVPHMIVKDADEETSIRATDKLRHLDRSEERRAIYIGATLNAGMIGDTYAATGFMKFQGTEPKKIAMATYGGLTLLAASMEETILYTCDGTPIEFSFSYLEQQQEREQLFRQLASDGIANGKLLRAIGELDKQLEDEDAHKMIPLSDVNLLYTIADRGERFMQRGPEREFELTSLLLRTFNKDRTICVSVKYREVAVAGSDGKVICLEGDERFIQGPLVDVVARKDTPDSESKKPSLAIQLPDDKIALVPFKHIDKFLF